MTSRTAVRAATLVSECRRIKLKTVSDPRGHLTIAESGKEIPFSFARLFYVYGAAPGTRRGGHAHRTLSEFIVCLAGSVEVTVFDGRRRKRVTLHDPSVGIHIPPMIWIDVAIRSRGSVYLVIASAKYDEADYIRDPAEFRAIVGRSLAR
jgi:dTDP-4-dehydrorhamnose 3,5-epimerase-like enzyme